MVLVDIRETKSVKASDIFLQIRPGQDFELISILRAMIKDQHVDDARIAETGLDRASLEDFVQRMKAAKGIDAGDIPADSLTKTDSIADAYWFAHQQKRDGWTHELDLRPSVETW